MANAAKFTKASCGHMFAHYERKKDENGEYIKFGNQNIDPNKSHLNYNLAVHQQERQGDFVRQRCSEVHCLNRKDVNVMCSWIVTQPHDFPSEQSKEFFEQTYKFLENRYGKENVVSAYVHMDEVSPHLHFAFVPVVEDKKKERLTVSAKNCIDKKELLVFHKELSSALNNYFEKDIGIHTDITSEQGGNKTISELKKETKKMQKELNALQGLKNELQGTINDLSDKKLVLNQSVLKLTKTLSESEVQEIDTTPAFLGGYKGFTPEQAQKSVNTNIILLKENKKLKKELEELKKENEKLEVDRSSDFISKKYELDKAMYIAAELKKIKMPCLLHKDGTISILKWEEETEQFKQIDNSYKPSVIKSMINLAQQKSAATEFIKNSEKKKDFNKAL